MKEKRTRGRPKSDNPRTKTVQIRLTEEEAASLVFYSNMAGTSKSSLLKDGMRMKINLIKHTKENQD